MIHDPLPPRDNRYLIWFLPLSALSVAGGAMVAWSIPGEEVEITLLGVRVDIALVGIVLDAFALSLLGWLWRREDRKD